MDRKSLDFRNDPVLNDPVLGRCRHDNRWDLCKVAECQEIWGLFEQQRKERRHDEEDWRISEIFPKRRERPSKWEIALQKKRKDIFTTRDYEFIAAVEPEGLPDAMPPHPRKLLRNIFPKAITLRGAIQFRVITLRQAKILKEYFVSDEGLAVHERWALIGEKIGFSGKTVEREFLVLVEKFLKTKKTIAGPKAKIEVVHVRGEQRPRYYRRHSLQFGEWKREWKELITDPKVIRQLRKDGNATDRCDQTPIPSSPVNRLFGALIRQLANELPKDGQIRPTDVSEADWKFNIRRAQRVLAGKKHLTGPWTASEVAKKLVRGGRLCGGCRTYLIHGFRINGRKITRAREYCDDACKMRAERRKKRTMTLIRQMQ